MESSKRKELLRKLSKIICNSCVNKKNTDCYKCAIHIIINELLEVS